jgi:hypothetical protein
MKKRREVSLCLDNWELSDRALKGLIDELLVPWLVEDYIQSHYKQVEPEYQQALAPTNKPIEVDHPSDASGLYPGEECGLAVVHEPTLADLLASKRS